MKLEDYVREVLSEKGLTLADLSQKAGIKYSTLHDMMKKELDKISFSNLMTISNALGVDITDLLGLGKPMLDYRESELLANYRQLSDESRSTVSGLATLLVKLERRQAAPPYTSANVHPGVTLPPVDQIADLKNAAFATDKTDTELNEDMTADD